MLRLFGAVLTLVLVGCSTQPPPAAAPTSAAPAPAAQQPTSAPAAAPTTAAPVDRPKTVAEVALYEGKDRQSILEAGARAEGKLMVYTSGVDTQIGPLINGFSARY